MNIAVVIATYGGEEWRDLAMSRAYPSALAQVDMRTSNVMAYHEPHGTLATARNAGALAACEQFDFDDPWLCFLDADDELAPGYLKAMEFAWLAGAITTDWRPLLIPRVQYVSGHRRSEPKYPAFRPGADAESLQDGNWLVIGTLINRTLFSEVGGFEEWPMYEDWALWARAWKAGAQLVQVPDAIYVAHRRRASRNVAGENQKREAHRMIRRAVFPELYEEVT